jgi:toxin ParE1/3/4
MRDKKRMPKYVLQLTEIAEEDLTDIYCFIAQDNPEKAKEYIELLKDRMGELFVSPKLGVERNEIKKALRFLPFEKYHIFYLIEEKTSAIRIERVLHGARDIFQIFN